MGVRLQHLLRDVLVPMGDFFIGRGPECQLVLEDTLVSRRHAVLRVESTGATIEDLGSRNGVHVNGVRVQKQEPLHDGDVIRIGTQDLGFYDTDETLASDRFAGQAGKPGAGAPSSRRSGGLPRLPVPDDDDDDPPPTGVVAQGLLQCLGVIGSVADKAIALGRADEAERLMQRWLMDILARASNGEVDLETAERAATYALRLAGATGHGTWLDYTFRLYTVLGALPPTAVVDDLHAMARRVKPADKAALRAYMGRLREISNRFGLVERSIQRRIEELERRAS